MGYTKATIANCKTASIRRCPWIPLFDKEVVGEKKAGDSIEIDTGRICHDWKDRRFYRTRDPSGWIHDGVVDTSGKG